MRILKNFLCKHEYKLAFTCEFNSNNGTRRIKVEECTKCGKIRKSII